MAEFLLIHGSWLGAWSWSEVIAGLTLRGHRANAIDLPGHGADPAPPEEVTLQDYVDRVIAAARRAENAPILVGHCVGGLIGLVAEAVPESIRALVYVTALVPPSGYSMMHFLNAFDPRYLAQLQWAPDRRTALISLEGAREFLLPACAPELADWAFARFTPEPAAPFEAPFFTTEDRFGRVRRFYVECERDRVIPVALQRAMCSEVSFEGAYSLDTDHSPMFSAPDELSSILLRIADRV